MTKQRVNEVDPHPPTNLYESPSFQSHTDTREVNKGYQGYIDTGLEST